jgi:20S proteasome alpha/beta subunit
VIAEAAHQHLRPNPRRLPKRKAVTLVAAISCLDRLIVIGDREENSEYAGKRSIPKIYESVGEHWRMGIGSAGSGPLGDKAAKQIILAAKQDDNFPSRAIDLIEEELKKIYTKYIFPFNERKQSERGISLVIGIKEITSGLNLVYKTYEEIVKEDDWYACAGSGQDIAHYFLDNFYDDLSSGEEVERFMYFVAREAKLSVGGVGGQTEMLTLHDSGLVERTLLGQTMEAREIPPLQDCMAKFWKSQKG